MPFWAPFGKIYILFRGFFWLKNFNGFKIKKGKEKTMPFTDISIFKRPCIISLGSVFSSVMKRFTGSPMNLVRPFKFCFCFDLGFCVNKHMICHNGAKKEIQEF